jgi:hypothetical protein
MLDERPSCHPFEPSKRIEEARASEIAVAPEQAVDNEPNPKPATSKGRARKSKARKPKRSSTAPKPDAAERLPLDEPGNEVDVQFSSPDAKPEENKP